MSVKIFGEHDDGTITQIHRCVGTGGLRGVLCADGHKGYAQPIGGVVAYRGLVSISGVGFDIACGNMAIRTNARAEDLAPDMPRIMDEVVRRISFGVGRTSKEPVDHELFDDPIWAEEPFRHLKTMARDQLGTVGSGNHYVDIFSDETGAAWVGVHFGSRGLGHKTATYFLKKAGGERRHGRCPNGRPGVRRPGPGLPGWALRLRGPRARRAPGGQRNPSRQNPGGGPQPP